jgi:hypothetical protein
LDWLLEKPDGKLPLGKNLHIQKKLALDPYYAISQGIISFTQKDFIELPFSEINKDSFTKVLNFHNTR